MPTESQSSGKTLPGAVFFSYASEDAEAVRPIVEALRARGVEVWFDKDALRGGDAWDLAIRQQIRECALFVPVISASLFQRFESRGNGAITGQVLSAMRSEFGGHAERSS